MIYANAPRLLTAICLIIASLVLPGCADKEQEEAARALVETRIAEREVQVAKVKAEAAQRVDRRLLKVRPFDREAARNRLVLEKYGINMEKTELCSQEQTRELLEARAIGATDEIYPPSRRRALVDQVAKEFPLFEVGDQVAVSTRTNRGASGVIENISSTHVKIGRVSVLIADITAPDPVCFNRETCEKQRRFIVHNNFDVPRRDELARQRQRLLPEVMKECGYVFTENQWRRVDTFFKPVIEPLVQKEEEAYMAEKKAEVRQEVETELLAEGMLPLPPPVNNPYAEE